MLAPRERAVDFFAAAVVVRARDDCAAARDAPAACFRAAAGCRPAAAGAFCAGAADPGSLPCVVATPAPAPATATVAATAAAFAQPLIGSAYWLAAEVSFAPSRPPLPPWPPPPNQRRLRNAGIGSSAAIFSRRDFCAASAATSKPAAYAARRQGWQ